MKLLSIRFTVLFSLIFSANAFAISDESLANKCLSVGKAKIEAQAEAWGCTVDIENVEVADIDNRFANPVKYIWYTASSECDGSDTITKLVQYSKGQCF